MNTPVRPRQVGIAVSLLLWSAGLAVLGLFAAFTTDADGLTIVLSVLGILLQIGLAYALGEGHNWARIVTIAFIGLSVVLTVVGIAGIAALFAYGGVGVFLGLLSVAQIVIGVAVLVVLVQAPTAAWFRSRP